MTFANEASREVNRKQQETHLSRPHLGREAPQAHGPQRHRHPGDLDRARAVLLLGRARARAPDRRASSTRTSPRSATTIPTASSAWRRCRCRSRNSPCAELDARGEGAGHARRRDLHQRRRRGAVGRALPPVLRQGRRNSTSSSSCTRRASPSGRRLSDHYFINVIGNPLDSTVAVHHLIFGGVLEAYPRLKIVVAHGGGYLPAYSGRIDHGTRRAPTAAASSQARRRAI